MEHATARNKVKLWRLGIEGLERGRATCVTQRFPRRAHDGFAVGVVEDGALGFFDCEPHGVASSGIVQAKR